MRLSSLVGTVVLGYIGVTLFYALLQRSFIYYPQTQRMDSALTDVARLGGSAWLDKDGTWLGWYKSEPGATRRVLVMHGNAGQALDRQYWINLFFGLDQSGPWEVYIMEYPGYGPRAGRPTEQTLRNAALQAMDQLQAQRAGAVLLLGESLGSGVAAHVVAARPEAVAGLILVTPFSSLGATARHHLPFLPVSLLLRDRFDTLELLTDFKGPMVMVTGRADRTVPERLALPLKSAHQGPLLHWSQPGAEHNTLDLNPRSAGWREIDVFLARYLEPGPAV
ncbi:alpha/beta fold hydrolase [Haliea sp. E1-2-M8]|uniref:alpha/beta hydrolase n=1 Tax=Haliea sp. E1-2-M8 TaxID=3064706 RepID=UPI0027202540|nr:alpha/beta fold hydrolase [Haliea sp. E1-2-M8]MDO8863737.1 alpha/beta fold hydrolase [Haliea sp. E1-2-M8]